MSSGVIEKSDIKMTDQKDILFYHLHSSLGSTLIPPLIQLIIDYARSFWFIGDTKNGVIYDPLTEQTWPILFSGKKYNLLLCIHSNQNRESTETRIFIANNLYRHTPIATVDYHISVNATTGNCNVHLPNMFTSNDIICTSQYLYMRCATATTRPKPLYKNAGFWQRFDLSTRKWQENMFDTSPKENMSDTLTHNMQLIFQNAASSMLLSAAIGPRSFLVIEKIPFAFGNTSSSFLRCFTYDHSESDDMHIIKEIPLNNIVIDEPLVTGMIREGYDMVISVLNAQTMLQFNIKSRCPLIVDKPIIVNIQKHDLQIVMLIADSNLWGVSKEKLYKFCFQSNSWILFKAIKPLFECSPIIGIV
jgi:hypothetical protein